MLILTSSQIQTPGYPQVMTNLEYNGAQRPARLNSTKWTRQVWLNKSLWVEVIILGPQEGSAWPEASLQGKDGCRRVCVQGDMLSGAEVGMLQRKPWAEVCRQLLGKASWSFSSGVYRNVICWPFAFSLLRHSVDFWPPEWKDNGLFFFL